MRCALTRARARSAPRTVVAGGEADAGADGGDVVEVVPGALELEQDGAHARVPLWCRDQVRPRRRVRTRRCSRRSRRRRRERRREARPRASFLGGAFESAVLVEEAGVEVEDAFAYEVEAEVPGLDHAGMDGRRRPGRVVAADGDGPGVELESWRTAGRSGSWPSKRTPWRSCAPRVRPSPRRGRGRRSTGPCRPQPRPSRAGVVPSRATSSVADHAPLSLACSPAKRQPPSSACAIAPR